MANATTEAVQLENEGDKKENIVFFCKKKKNIVDKKIACVPEFVSH